MRVNPTIPNCKAHPDEKGIETSMCADDDINIKEDCKAHPDEKGIETVDNI